MRCDVSGDAEEDENGRDNREDGDYDGIKMVVLRMRRTKEMNE